MKYALFILAIFGIVVSSLALREHYREEGDAPCSINERWDCGIVNKSPYAMIPNHAEDWPLPFPIPVAVFGILGYILMCAWARMRSYRILIVDTVADLACSHYRAHNEKDSLDLWCNYC